MNKRVELPLTEPLFSTYHYQGNCGAIIAENTSVRNWYLTEAVNMTCNRKFLSGFTSPDVSIINTSWVNCPYFEVIWLNSRFAKGYINSIIRQMLDEGYYVVFNNVDDYYVEGKTWYKERHFNHDGMICGYDQKDKTYCLYCYDSKWVYRKFWTSQRSFNNARIAMEKKGIFVELCALKVKNDEAKFLPQIVYERLKEYLDSDIKKYPFEGEDSVFGIVVHEFVAEYIAKLYRGEIPYEQMDRRVFRLIWEHKKAMYERIELMEKSLGLNSTISRKYANLVKEADTMRMLYASHYMKRRDSVLPIIKKMLLKLMQEERKLLNQLIEETERMLANETVEISEE